MNTAELRRKAAHCLRLADGAIPVQTADLLRRLADEYEREAMAQESGAAARPATTPPAPVA
jgi:hypothetical protein